MGIYHIKTPMRVIRSTEGGHKISIQRMEKAGIVIIITLLMLLAIHAPLYADEARKVDLPWGQATILMEEGGALMPKDTFVIEPGFSYSHTSRTRISISGFTLLEVIVIGRIINEDVKRDTLTPFVNVRYGLTDDTQLEVKIPYMFRYDREVIIGGPSGSDVVERRVNAHALGDIDVGLNHLLVSEQPAMPDIVLNLRGKSITGREPYGLQTEMFEGKQRLKDLPTGSGHYGFSAGLTFAKTSDPAVFFGNVGYFYNFKRNIGVENGTDYGEIKPGDSIESSIGMAFALNEHVSTSISYLQRFTFKTEQNGEKVVNSDMNMGNISFGVSYALSPITAISVSVGIGLTKDAPDATVSVRVPMSIL